MKILPLFPTLPGVRYAINLDDRVFRLRLRFFDRANSWYLDIDTNDGIELSVGVRVITDHPLVPGRRRGAEFPRGQLFAIDMKGEGRIPGRFDLSPTGFARLVFVPNDELPAAPANPNIVDIEVV